MIPIPAVPGDRRRMETRAAVLSVPTYRAATGPSRSVEPPLQIESTNATSKSTFRSAQHRTHTPPPPVLQQHPTPSVKKHPAPLTSLLARPHPLRPRLLMPGPPAQLLPRLPSQTPSEILRRHQPRQPRRLSSCLPAAARCLRQAGWEPSFRTCAAF
jgi:hypothetical protein